MASKQKATEDQAEVVEQSEEEICPLCGNRMTYIQVCHLRCNFCGSELSCEDKGWFWG